MTKQEFVDAVAGKSGLSKRDAGAAVDAFLETPWSGEERHQRRIDILSEYERTGDAPAVPGAPSADGGSE